MLIPLGILASAGGVSAAYELISTTVLGSNTSSVTFSSLPATYKHFQLRMVTLNTSSSNTYKLQFNGDTGSNYAWHTLLGNATDVRSQASPSSTSMNFVGSWSGQSTTVPATAIVDILDPLSTTKNKTVRTLGGCQGSNEVGLYSGLWMSTSAVTSLTITGTAGSYTTGSRFSLYGLR
jgi:hypothetical protein